MDRHISSYVYWLRYQGVWDFFNDEVDLNEKFHDGDLLTSNQQFNFPPGDDLDQSGLVFQENIVGKTVEIKIGRRYRDCKVIEYLGNGTHKVMDESENLRTVNLHNFLLNKKLRLDVQKHVCAHIVQFMQSRLIAARSMPIDASG